MCVYYTTNMSARSVFLMIFCACLYLDSVHKSASVFIAQSAIFTEHV